MNSNRPIMLGVVGDSATGKTTVTDGLVTLIGADRVTHICTDDYHRYDRVERDIHNITALHPDCNYLDILEFHLEHLAKNEPILKPVYDHSTGTCTRPVYVQPRDLVMIEGLLGFYSEKMRRLYDVMIYLDPDERLRRMWKVRRDSAKRGYTPSQVLEQIAKRASDSRQFIRPQRQYADIVIQFYVPPNRTLEEVGANLNVRLILRPTIPHPDLGYLWTSDRRSGIRLEQYYDEHHILVDVLEIDGNVSNHEAAALERAIWHHLPELHPLRADQFGDYEDRTVVRHSNPLALTQLLLTFHVLRQQHTGRSDVSPPPPLPDPIIGPDSWLLLHLSLMWCWLLASICSYIGAAHDSSLS